MHAYLYPHDSGFVGKFASLPGSNTTAAAVAAVAAAMLGVALLRCHS